MAMAVAKALGKVVVAANWAAPVAAEAKVVVPEVEAARARAAARAGAAKEAE